MNVPVWYGTTWQYSYSYKSYGKIFTILIVCVRVQYSYSSCSDYLYSFAAYGLIRLMTAAETKLCDQPWTNPPTCLPAPPRLIE